MSAWCRTLARIPALSDPVPRSEHGEQRDGNERGRSWTEVASASGGQSKHDDIRQKRT